ncbi:RING-H2 finger protein ATL46 [Raphanus sativus]|uniref:RING-type E3 ubiquitin transferase n=1 Tax=Raphanus sativus TaxID=3726 RepID=A0A9W3DMM8_RAPSA|nr:RING-H2 finger protein ATL46 [Raphanus sativus]KAJ4902477.1 RING-H2 finger protein ATL46 [Raphanus sativus]
MYRVRFAIEQKDGTFAYPPPFYRDPILPPPSPPPPSGNRISPAVLFVIVILAVLFFISGLLHLLVRFLIKHPSPASASRSNRYPEISTSDALQRQLQQLFHLNDSGLDQAFIDALPVFHYKEMVGGASKEPFDCAVCLCEFTEKDKLRLLPMCSHAFHLNCIDTWLQSNSTCPLCRGTLFSPGFSMENPMFDFDDVREEEERVVVAEKATEIQEIVVEKGVLPVRLGKFKRLDNVGRGQEDHVGETSSSNLDARRCFSMGSYQYILGNSELKVPFCNDRQLRLKPQDKECQDSSAEEKKMSSVVAKGESFSVSKIWLWPKKDKFSSDAQRRLPSSSLNVDDLPKLPWMEEHRKLENGER